MFQTRDTNASAAEKSTCCDGAASSGLYFWRLMLLYDTSHKAGPGATGGYTGTDQVNKLNCSDIALPFLILVYRHGGRPSNPPSRIALEVTLFCLVPLHHLYAHILRQETRLFVLRLAIDRSSDAIQVLHALATRVNKERFSGMSLRNVLRPPDEQTLMPISPGFAMARS